MFNREEIRESIELAEIDRDIFRGMPPRNYSRKPTKLEQFMVEWAMPVAGGALAGAIIAAMLFFSL